MNKLERENKSKLLTVSKANINFSQKTKIISLLLSSLLIILLISRFIANIYEWQTISNFSRYLITITIFLGLAYLLYKLLLKIGISINTKYRVKKSTKNQNDLLKSLIIFLLHVGFNLLIAFPYFLFVSFIALFFSGDVPEGSKLISLEFNLIIIFVLTFPFIALNYLFSIFTIKKYFNLKINILAFTYLVIYVLLNLLLISENT